MFSAKAVTEQSEHALTVLSSVNDMRLREFLCDFRIIVGSETLNAHRLVLAANSGYFKSLFSSNMKEAEQGSVTIELLDSESIKQCIQFMYTSCCKIQSSSVSNILEAANFLQIIRLEEKCFKFLLLNLSPENSLSVLQLSTTFNRDDVTNAAEHVIQNNLEVVISSGLFPTLGREDLTRLIARADCKISWKAITTWCAGKEAEFCWFMKNTVFSEYYFDFLLKVVLQDCQVKSQNLEAYVIRGLFYDEEALRNHLNIQNCFQLYQYAVAYLEIYAIVYDPFNKLAADERIMNVIRSFMEHNFSKIIFCPGYCSLSVQEVKMLLNSDAVLSEEWKWKGISVWIESDVTERKTHFASLFQLLELKEFPLQFLRVLSSVKLVKENNDCLKILVDALFDQQLDTAQEIGNNESSDISGDEVDLGEEPDNCKDVKKKNFRVTCDDAVSDWLKYEDPESRRSDSTTTRFHPQSNIYLKLPPSPGSAQISSSSLSALYEEDTTAKHSEFENGPPTTSTPLTRPLPGDSEPVFASGILLHCNLCSQKLGFRRRRHICKACGEAYCSSCCNEKCQLKYLGDKMAKVCTTCSKIIKEGWQTGWQLPRRYLRIQAPIFYGDYHHHVYKGLWNGCIEVAIKHLKEGTISKEDFLRESETLKILQHKNIVGLYGEVIESPVYIVLEFMHFGDLRKYLMGRNVTMFSQWIKMASQVAAGLAYIESKKCVHRCIMATNVLVNKHRICKISHFQMACFIENGDYKAKDDDQYPIRWTAPEVFSEGIFNLKSDVWSFGVLLYEIATSGVLPYLGLSNTDVTTLTDRRIEQPTDCPDSFYEIMLLCWQKEPMFRPTWTFLQEALQNLSHSTEETDEASAWC